MPDERGASGKRAAEQIEMGTGSSPMESKQVEQE